VSRVSLRRALDRAARRLLPAGLGLILAFCAGRAPRPQAAQGQGPADLPAFATPQFICVSSDDNGFSGLPGSGSEGGLHFLTALFASLRNPAGAGDVRSFDGRPPHYTFFVNTRYAVPDEGPAAARPGSGAGRENPVYVKRAWREAVERGHEVGVHTHTHPHGGSFTVREWEDEMRLSIDLLVRPWDARETPERPNPGSGLGVSRASILGFRAPFLEPSDNAMAAAFRTGFIYDSSIEDGPGLGPHKGTFAWPFAFDQGLPQNVPPIGRYPGFWEIPLGNFVVPSDAECARYGAVEGLRERLKKVQGYFDPANGEITGADWNLWNEFSVSPEEFLSILKCTLERHLSGNRAPMTLVLHSAIYTVKADEPPGSPVRVAVEARRAALKAFLAYALAQPEVRLVSGRELLGWLRRPARLR
jgi:hypothetical protein